MFDNPNAWKNIKKNLPFGILEWEEEEHTTIVYFLELRYLSEKIVK